MKIIKQILLVLFISMTLTFTGIAQDQYFLQGGKPKDRPKERDKKEDPPKGKDRGDRDRDGGRRDRKPD